MGKKGNRQIEGYFDYVVPPLEVFWWQDRTDNIDYSDKGSMRWISVIRLPDFVTREDFEWVVWEAVRKKGPEYSKAEFMTLKEGLCAQCLHVGPYDDEPRTVDLMTHYAEEHGYTTDMNDSRHHHEIYLSDARRISPDRLKTVIRHPVRRTE